jgi:predicted nucleic acid-binding protein
MLVADASVLVKCVLLEPGSPVARQLVTESSPTITPGHAQAECVNAIWKYVHRGALSPDRARDALEYLQSIPLRLRPLRKLTSDAFALALEYDHPVYDCYYLACAIQNQCALATADERLYDLAQRVGFGERAVLVR